MRSEGKTPGLLQALAPEPGSAIPRSILLDRLWPGNKPSLAGQCLNSLVYSLHRFLGDSIGGAAPVVHDNGGYRLNVEAGVGVDVLCFDAAVEAGEREAREGNLDAAAKMFQRAIEWYAGDLCNEEDIQSAAKRERLRALYLSLLARLADHRYACGDYAACLGYAQQLLSDDPCREDGHRLIMRCYVRRGERAQAVRQYRLCEHVLRVELDANPEPATQALFDRVLATPASI
jgi:DNA-binding SARP family transcriptional activator